MIILTIKAKGKTKGEIKTITDNQKKVKNPIWKLNPFRIIEDNIPDSYINPFYFFPTPNNPSIS